MARVRLSVDVEPELRRRVRMAAASRDQSVKEWLEDVLERELRRTDEDVAWMEGDLSRLGEFEAYDWAEGELEDEVPPEQWILGVRFVAGLCDTLGIDTAHIYGHHDFAEHKTCPGKKFNLIGFRTQVNELLKGG